MNCEGEGAPTRQNIKSHLQKYRLLMQKRARQEPVPGQGSCAASGGGEMKQELSTQGEPSRQEPTDVESQLEQHLARQEMNLKVRCWGGASRVGRSVTGRGRVWCGIAGRVEPDGPEGMGRSGQALTTLKEGGWRAVCMGCYPGDLKESDAVRVVCKSLGRLRVHNAVLASRHHRCCLCFRATGSDGVAD